MRRTATGLHPDILRNLGRGIEVAKNYSPAARKQAASEGAALPDGSYPIYSTRDLENAVSDYNRTGQSPTVKAHIEQRAKAIGAKPPFADN